MTHLIDSFAHNALLLFAVVTILLAVGASCLCVARSPADRQRIGELTLAAVLGWLVLAAIPLPRWLPGMGMNVDTTAQGIPTVGDDRLKADSDAVIDPLIVDRPLAGQSHLESQPIMLPVSSQPSADQVIAGMPAAQPEATLSSSPQAVGAASPPVERPFVAAQPPRTAHNAPASSAVAGAPHRAAAPSKSSWPLIAAWIYLGCMAAAGFWLLVGHVLLIRERFTAAAPPPWLYRLLHSSVSTWRGRLPRLVVSRRASRPLSWGVWRPIIALPERICDAGNREQLRTILLHEMGHIERGDARGCLVFELAFPLLFFHPLYWWLRGQVRMAAELVADDWAAGQTGKEVYVAELVALARGTRLRRLSILAGTGVLSSPSQFYRRMQMLLTRENPLATRPTRQWRLASLAGLAVAVAFAAALAGNSPAADEKSKPAPAPETPKSATNQAPTPIATDGPAAGLPNAPAVASTDAATEELKPPVAVSGGPPATESARPSTDGPATTPAAGETAPPIGLPGEPTRPREAAPATDPSPRAGNEDPRAADQLLAEKRRLLDEIQSLRAKLHELEGNSAGTGAGRMGVGGPAAMPDKRTVVVTRIDEKGHYFQERWSTDEKGRPANIIETHEVGATPVDVSTSVVSQDKVMKVFKDSAGHVWSHTYDAKTGKVIESRDATAAMAAGPTLTSPAAVETAADPTKPQSTTAPSAAPALAAGSGYPGLTPPPVAAPFEPPPVQPPSATPWQPKQAANASTRPIDLVALATSYADAISAVELAKVKLAEAETAGQTNELRSRRVAVENAVRKGNLLRRIAQVTLAGAKQEADRMASLRAAGAISADAASEVEARLEILKQIIDAGGGGDTVPEPKPRTN